LIKGNAIIKKEANNMTTRHVTRTTKQAWWLPKVWWRKMHEKHHRYSLVT